MFEILLNISSIIGMALIIMVPLFVYFGIAILKARKSDRIEKKHKTMKRLVFLVAFAVAIDFVALVASASRTDTYAWYLLAGVFLVACPYWIAALIFAFIRVSDKDSYAEAK